MGLFAYRLLGAAMLDAGMYEGIEADRRTTMQALTAVMLASLAAGVGAGDWLGTRLATLAAVTATAQPAAASSAWTISRSSPPTARPGATLALTTTYTLLTAEDTPIPVSTTREMFYQGKSLGVSKVLQTRNLNGTWTQKVDLPLAKDATPGIYTLVTRINTGYGRDEKTVQFAVQ